MARVLKDAAITTRAARSRLAIGLHWRGIDPDVHLGYRKGKAGGTWVARWRGADGYRQKSIGTADDVLVIGTLDYAAAIRASRKAVEAARVAEKAAADGVPMTVRMAVEEYIARRDARETKRAGHVTKSDATRRLTRYVIGREAKGKRGAVAAAPLADVLLHKLDETDLRKWREGLPAYMKESGRQRTAADLKAALNRAYEKRRRNLDPRLPEIIRIGLKSSDPDNDDGIEIARENQILSDGQVAMLLRAAREVDDQEGWEGDFFAIILAMAATGARFAQLVRMRVNDVQRSASRLMIPTSRKGKSTKVESIAVPVGQDVLDALLPRVTGRQGNATLFERWRHKQVAGSIRWARDARGPWKTPSELVRPWGAARERAGLPDVIPYALRHTSIVRALRANLPIRLVAALHDTSVVMIERHYARWIVDGLEELAARAIGPMVPTIGENVVNINRRGA